MVQKGGALLNDHSAAMASDGLRSITVDGLFGRYDHSISFPTIPPDADSPVVSVLVGPNGVGKTTVLRMLAGALSLDFMPFRGLPFTSCRITTTSNHVLQVEQPHVGSPLLVRFDHLEARLHPDHPGAAAPEDDVRIQELRRAALSVLERITFQLVDTHRGEMQRAREARTSEDWVDLDDIRKIVVKGKPKHSELTSKLADRVRKFMTDAQVDYRAFFATRAPNLIPKLVARLSEPQQLIPTKARLLERLRTVREAEEVFSRLGLSTDHQEVPQLFELIDTTEQVSRETMAVFEWYVEVLESQHQQRELIASRLLRFERIVNRYLVGKRVQVGAKHGLTISIEGGDSLREAQLSSGEYQLLFMMVTALVSSRSGTVIAIDEPELSLHVQWQRSLVKSLAECAAGAAPLLILATHSPTIAGEFRANWVQLGTDLQS
jgi:ABC-type cobalamin/Fe3+-siderophores transport system ATPase subunit